MKLFPCPAPQGETSAEENLELNRGPTAQVSDVQRGTCNCLLPDKQRRAARCWSYFFFFFFESLTARYLRLQSQGAASRCGCVRAMNPIPPLHVLVQLFALQAGINHQNQPAVAQASENAQLDKVRMTDCTNRWHSRTPGFWKTLVPTLLHIMVCFADEQDR